METYTQLRLLQKNARDLRSEMRSLRRLSQAQLSAVKEAVKDTIQIMKKTFLVNSDVITNALSDSEPSVIENSLRSIHRQEENYQKEMKQLERDLRYEIIIRRRIEHIDNIFFIVVVIGRFHRIFLFSCLSFSLCCLLVPQRTGNLGGELTKSRYQQKDTSEHGRC